MNDIIKKLVEDIGIYPNIKLSEKEYSFTLESIYRKLHTDGKYYLTLFRREYINPDSIQEMYDLTNHFHKLIYIYSIKNIPVIGDNFEFGASILDINQESEKDRLK